MPTSYKAVFLAAVLSLALNQSAAKHVTAQSQPQLVPKAREPILLNVTVTTKKGKFVAGLDRSNFVISIDNKPAGIVSVSDGDLPISVGIVIDASGSMGGLSTMTARKNFLAIREALSRFMELSNPRNEYFLLGFNKKPQLLVDWTSDRVAVIEKFDNLDISGNTAFYDACYLAIDKLHTARSVKRVLILISDGQDNLSRYTYNDVRDFLRNTNVLLYSLSFPRDVDLIYPLGQDGRSILDGLSSLSGGSSFYFKDKVPLLPEDANSALEEIANELRNQYTISLEPSEAGERKKWRKLKVKVNLPPETLIRVKRLEVRTREGLYQPAM